MNDLITWLRAALDERERAALAVPENARQWTLDGGTIHHGHPTDEVVDWVYVDGAREHIALNDPAAVLAEVNVDRLILTNYERALGRRKDHPDDLASAGALLTMLHVIKLLGLRYAHNEGYREEWRPE